MNSPCKKRQKTSETEKPTSPISPKTTPTVTAPAPSGGSRFSFASDNSLIQQAQKARESASQKPNVQTSNTVYEFAGEKISYVNNESIQI